VLREEMWYYAVQSETSGQSAGDTTQKGHPATCHYSRAWARFRHCSGRVVGMVQGKLNLKLVDQPMKCMPNTKVTVSLRTWQLLLTQSSASSTTTKMTTRHLHPVMQGVLLPRLPPPKFWFLRVQEASYKSSSQPPCRSRCSRLFFLKS
jgi:hypothetical protein